MNDDAVRERIAEGARLFNEAQFWHAHEAWEEAWLALREAGEHDASELVQGLILATAAFENLRRGKRAGFAVQLAKALTRLRAHGAHAKDLGIEDGETFREALTELYLGVMADRSVNALDGLSVDVPRLGV